MKDDKKNIFDSFLEKYDEYSDKKMVDIETYYRPSKKKCIFGFVFCLLFFLIFIRLFTFDIKFFVVLIGNVFCLIYFGLNLFTKKGFVIKQKSKVPEEFVGQDTDEEYNNYDIAEESYEEDRFGEDDDFAAEDEDINE